MILVINVRLVYVKYSIGTIQIFTILKFNIFSLSVDEMDIHDAIEDERLKYIVGYVVHRF